MDAEGARRVIAAYREKFATLQIEPTRFPKCQSPRTPQERLAHCFAILPEIEKFLDEGRVEKAMRWLGFVEGCLWSNGIFTIDELRGQNFGG